MTSKTPLPASSRRNAGERGPAARSHAAKWGLEQAFDEIPGIFAAMLDAFGRNGIRTLEDLAACATDDLVGWTERNGEQVTMHPGILGGIAVSRKQCDAIILEARVRAGWIEAAALTA
jgi:transcription termination/antitermination protein NusA